MDSQFLLFLFALAVAGVASKAAPVVIVWIQARRSGGRVSLLRAWGLFFANVPLKPVLQAHAAAARAGIEIDVCDMAAHALAGGDVRVVVQAYVESLRAGLPIEFRDVCELEQAAVPEEVATP